MNLVNINKCLVIPSTYLAAGTCIGWEIHGHTRGSYRRGFTAIRADVRSRLQDYIHDGSFKAEAHDNDVMRINGRNNLSIA